ncbi:Uncharacterized protein ALO70_04462 [Pseudomonas amygdali pv. eriobotryae]|uniref:Uncharacterized protein n=1 Tax=Pseudomonas amygdali pv. eriobotryae TaxID=129137 RepID=A0A0P9T6J4_PSEA0|nr:hypothetical protein [Pseudomonas amygdali]KPX36042.1 Uncharacterized protein ALO70_04462 [Pseudomonas amygdali pv. eriobotryae]KWS76870.1 hypothetical protein AL052_05420 [Pseudomonas amygdali pv. eriobotryae]RMM02714.1 hypothetical protein ALQ86_01044 [Pseudomonas amygdali pv. eriobotryae]RMO63754.1 hypothetical protein ALQ39_02604 [Pseudomonas amygdali pv. eriobotryae]GFZ70579.1 hypothetical protein PSE10C_13210 [Pseudomonas amygdali pv. eriobotryae]
MNEHSNSLLSQILAEQVKQTELMRLMTEQQTLLIEALSEEEPEDPDAPPQTYLDGTPCL